MKYRNGIVLLVVAIAIALFGAGCDSMFGPSDEDVIKAINDSGILKGGGINVTAPIEVLEKGKRGKDGSWPVKIKLTLTLKAPDGQPSTRVTNPLFRIYKSKDASGNTVWTAKVGA